MRITLKKIREIIREEIVREYQKAINEVNPLDMGLPTAPTRRSMPGITSATEEKPEASPFPSDQIRRVMSRLAAQGVKGKYNRVYRVQDDGVGIEVISDGEMGHSMNAEHTAMADRSVGMIHRLTKDSVVHEPGKEYVLTFVI